MSQGWNPEQVSQHLGHRISDRYFRFKPRHNSPGMAEPRVNSVIAIETGAGLVAFG
ncbi:hypothetical protein [Coleofasciculus sp.]|uniref:hypothetical protein n=1 Tax=Coleofasciculus sp. TaxID=3100458 RepID=UPI003A195352